MKYLLKKAFTLIITLLLVSAVTFGAFSIIPGNIAITRLGQNATPERIAALEAEMGLDRPLAERYVDWLSNALHGDFGESYQYSGVAVSDLLLERLPVTLILTAMSLFLILIISIPLGLLAARKEGTVIDTAVNLLTQVTMAIPAFFLGMIITFVFGLALKWFQPGKFAMPQEDLFGCITYLIFPAVAIALPKIAMVVKFLRNSEKYRRLSSRAILKLPIAGELVKKYQISRFCRLMHLMTGSGIPVLQALRMMSGIMTFHPFSESIRHVCETIEKGGNLADGIADDEYLYGKRFVVLIRVGEETSSLDHMFKTQAEDAASELEFGIRQMNSIIEPALILFIGIIVAFVLISMYLPMFKLGTTIQ